jgi:hypothetical protein
MPNSEIARAPLPAERRRGRITHEKRERFLEALRAGWTVTHAADHAGVHRRRFYEAREADEAFAAAWAEAWEQGTDRLEDELRRRSVDGFNEDTYDGEGALIRRVHRYDGTGLVKLLGARRPEKFREGAAVEVKTPAVFVIESAFARADIEAAQAEPPLELPRGDT